jgi:hypothetical protein
MYELGQEVIRPKQNPLVLITIIEIRIGIQTIAVCVLIFATIVYEPSQAWQV